MKYIEPPVLVKNPCPRRWADMEGDAQRRFCAQCQLPVHNLSTMTEGRRQEFLAGLKGPACITYEMLPDGRIAVPRELEVERRMRGWIAATVLAMLLPFFASGCASRREGSPPKLAGGKPVAKCEPEQEPARVIVTGGI